MADTEPKQQADADVVTVNMDQEVAKLAKRDQAEGRLDKPVSMPSLRDLYRRDVLQYYAGKDRGYQEGFLAGARAARPWPWYVWAPIGAAAPWVAYAAVVVVSKFARVVEAVGRVIAE